MIEKSTKRNRKYWVSDDGGVTRAECTRCLRVKSVEEFSKDSRVKIKLKSLCKECANNEYLKRRDVALQYNRERYSENPSKYKERVKQWKESNCEYVLEYARKHYSINKHKYANNMKEWQQNNREKISIYQQNRRAKEKSLVNDFTQQQFDILMSIFDGKCALTGDMDIHLDHVIPIAIGHGGTTLPNIIPLRSDLNQSKNANNIFEWFPKAQERYGLSTDKFEELVAYLAKVNRMTKEEYREYVYWCFDNPNNVTSEYKIS